MVVTDTSGTFVAVTAFTGSQAAAAWQALGGTGYAPVQAVQPGPNTHWSQAAGLCQELMAPTVNAQSRLSALTLAALADLGWSVRLERAEPYTRGSC